MSRPLRMPKDPLEIKVDKSQMDEINIVRAQTVNIYNFHRSIMIMLVKEMAGKKWTFEDSDPIKLEFSPEERMVKISVDDSSLTK